MKAVAVAVGLGAARRVALSERLSAGESVHGVPEREWLCCRVGPAEPRIVRCQGRTHCGHVVAARYAHLCIGPRITNIDWNRHCL